MLVAYVAIWAIYIVFQIWLSSLPITIAGSRMD